MAVASRSRKDVEQDNHDVINHAIERVDERLTEVKTDLKAEIGEVKTGVTSCQATMHGFDVKLVTMSTTLESLKTERATMIKLIIAFLSVLGVTNADKIKDVVTDDPPHNVIQLVRK